MKWLSVTDLTRLGSNPTKPAGFATHNNISKAFRQSQHTDPGVGFPQDYFMALVRWYSRWYRPVVAGVRGTDVLYWKARLRKLGYKGFVVLLPYFGGGIQKATKEFQYDKHLPVTGVVNPATWVAAAG
jgi:peptidoglycan hydrolase-like protein with peptidoglycan-binding domain